MSQITRVLILANLLLTGCVDPITPEYDYQTGFLLVEGRIVDRPGFSEIRVSRSTIEFGLYRLAPQESVTVISIEDGDREVEWRQGSEAGTYVPPDSFVAQVGSSYQIRLLTPEGEIIESDTETLPTPVLLSRIEMQFDQEAYYSTERERFVPAFTILADFDDPTATDDFYQFKSRTWSQTSICETCYGGVFRQGECIAWPGVDFYDYLCDVPCWGITRDPRFDLLSDEFNPGGQYRGLPVARIDFVGSGGLLAQVEQYTMTRKAHAYYSVLRELTEGSSGLNAPLPAALYGNLQDLSDLQTNVLGYVSATAVTSERLFWNRDTVPGTPLYGRRVPQLEPIDPSPPSAPCSGPNFTAVKPAGWLN